MYNKVTATSQNFPLNGGTNRFAVVYMLIAVSFFGLVPLVIVLGKSHNPLLYSAAMRIGIAIFSLLILRIFYWRILKMEGIISFIRGRIFSREIAFILFSYFDFVALTLSLRWLDAATVAVIYEIWPIILIFIVARWTDGHYQGLDIQMVLLLIVAFSGVTFVLASQSGGFQLLLQDILGDYSLKAYAGFTLAFAAACITAFTGFSWVWARNTVNHKDIPRSVKCAESVKSLQMSFLLVALVLTNVVASLINGIIGLAYGEITGEWITFGWFFFAVVGGMFSYGVASVTWRYATSLTQNVGIHAVSYGTPVASLIFLAIVSQLGQEVKIDYIIIGVVAIIIANLLINFEAEIRLGFKALLLTLGGCGVIIYLRDGIFEFSRVDRWHWTGGGYFEALALSATVFTLLLAFRVSRLIGRTGDEDNRTFSVFRKLDILVQRGIINNNILDCILRIDAPKDQADLESAYDTARNYIAEARAKSNSLKDVDLQFLSEAESNLDALAHSKQQDITPGEKFALGIFAGITISLALFSRPPEAEGWNRLLVDIFAILISSVIVFLLVNVWDLRRERNESKLRLRVEQQDYAVSFSDTGQRSVDQWLSMIVGGAIVLAYFVLLAHKWVGWFGWFG